MGREAAGAENLLGGREVGEAIVMGETVGRVCWVTRVGNNAAELLEVGIVNPQGETSHVVACDVHRC
jgi:hypothetical protein